MKPIVKNARQITCLLDYTGLGYDESCLWDEVEERYDVAFDLAYDVSEANGAAALAVFTEFCEGLTGGILK